MPRKVKGERRRRNGWRVFIRVNGHLYTKQFPITSTPEKRREWREDQRAKHRPAGSGTFEADVQDYLERVAAMPSYKERAYYLALWLDALGRSRSRHSITPHEIDRQLQIWLTTHAPMTVRHRRTALQSFFVKLDGKFGSNPVRASANPKVPPAEPRGLDYPTIAKVLAAMPTHQDVKPGAEDKPALGRLRVAVLAYTGMPPGMLRTLTAHDIDLKAGTLRQPARTKGHGAAGRTIPLTADGLTALKAFDAAKAYGAFSVGRLNYSFKRACKRLQIDPRVRLYDLRHSFGRELYRLTRDLATVARFLGHAPGSTITARYADGANASVDAAAAQAFSAARRAELPHKLPATKKRPPRKDLRRAS